MAKSNLTAYCPACDGEIKFTSKPKIGRVLNCKQCETELEVVDFNPISLDWTFDDDLYNTKEQYSFDDYDYEY